MAAVFNAHDRKITHNCLIRIQSVYETLKSAEKRAADFMLNHPAAIAGTTITEAAALANCSEATLVRLARKLGYSGYPELKVSISENHHDAGSGILYEEIASTDTPLTVAEKVFQTSLRSLMDTFNLLDERQYQEALTCIMKANRILLIGSGDAHIVAYTGFLKFSRIGLNAICSMDFDIQLIEASKMNEKDIIIAVSHTGRTQTLQEVIREAKKHGAVIITITNYPTSPLAKLSDVVLLTAAFVPDNQGEIMSKRIPELCILESLYINIIMRSRKDVAGTLSRSNLAVRTNKI
ncbi:MAG: MurR/RpiR family transcriptional regulator [Treponema sp.]|jgi:DNA-binding MurR/RpiR family transcriptional regulator|nr:MurR/RpiR family transcriptional regulator [Treponema sp.]